MKSKKFDFGVHHVTQQHKESSARKAGASNGLKLAAILRRIKAKKNEKEEG